MVSSTVEVCLVLAPDVDFFLNPRKQGLPSWRSFFLFLLCCLKGVLGVKRTTPNWAVLPECGQEPLQIGSALLPSFLTFYFAGIVACST